MKIALDLEDVLVRTNKVFMEELNSFIRENHPQAQLVERPEVAEWRYPEMRRILSDLQGWNCDEEKKFFYGDSDGWEGYHPITERKWRDSPESFEKEIEDIRGVVKKLNQIVENSDGELALVTARENVRESIIERIEQLGINDFLDEVIIETEKHDLDFDVYIDDYPFLHQKLDGSRQIMVDKPWNRGEKLEEPHQRVEDVNDAVEVIKDLG